MNYSVQLLVIDPQNDFCDLPPSYWPEHGNISPSLAITGAHQHMQRLARWINEQGLYLDQITVTLDSHQRFDIAHPGFWQQADGSAPAAFTTITADAVRAGQFAPRLPAHLPRALAYLDTLERQGSYQLMVWPVHCEVGSWGYCVHNDLLDALGTWQLQRQRTVQHALKGQNPWTEHYSALMAEVIDPADPATALNRALLERLAQAELLIIAGEASSHCVRTTVEHLLAHLPAGHAQRLTLLTDCMGPVAGFEAAEKDFFSAIAAQGVQLTRSDRLSIAHSSECLEPD